MFQLRNHQNTVIDILSKNRKGQVIVPTGGGKTMCMIEDAKKVSGTIVVVAPRILLAEQLSSEFLEIIDNVSVMHVHSGETTHFSSTKASDVYMWDLHTRGDKIIFTTYHSLHKIQESHIHVDTIYFDEAHNGIQKNFIEAVEWFSICASRCYFFTATPKHSNTPMKVGMNDWDIFGEVLINVPAPQLVNEGHILPPKVIIKDIDVADDSRFSYEKDCDHILDTIDDIDVDKVLICARSTKQIVNLISLSDFAYGLTQREYNWLYITAKTGAVINGKKVDRETFFNTLNTWGKGSERFVVLHHSILSEGINVSGLEAALFLRSMDYVGISQTIGRVIRKGDESKTYGLVVVPCYDKVGITTSRKVNAVVDTVFKQGQPAISVIKK
jgi:superfamily II DNA or RNA helicase